MKITTFNPLIVSQNADEVIALFEELGFEKRHTPLVDLMQEKYLRWLLMGNLSGKREEAVVCHFRIQAALLTVTF